MSTWQTTISRLGDTKDAYAEFFSATETPAGFVSFQDGHNLTDRVEQSFNAHLPLAAMAEVSVTHERGYSYWRYRPQGGWSHIGYAEVAEPHSLN